MDYISKRLGRAPLKKNPFYERFKVSREHQPNLMYNSLDQQALHTAMVHRSMYGPGKSGGHGTSWVSDPRLDVETNRHVFPLLRNCNGHNYRRVNIPKQRIPFGPFIEMCRFLRVDPRQLFASSQIDVWDPATNEVLRLSLYETRKRWTD